MDSNIILEVRDICKNFDSTKALSGVSMQVKAGEIHGLIGENGSGKSTLSAIIAGTKRNDSGTMFLRGRKYTPQNILDANRHHVSMVVQEEGTITGITVAANIYAGKEKQFTRMGFIRTKKLRDAAAGTLEKTGISSIDPMVPVNRLSFEDRKLVEISRAMLCSPDVLIIDETTTSLSEKGRNILYRIMHTMRDSGKAVLFISHDIDELIEQCDAVTILRDGSVTGNLDKAQMVPKAMKELMVGRNISNEFYRIDYDCRYGPEIAIAARNITYGGITNLSFEAHKGEILGFGGLTNCGMHETGKILYGILRPKTGCVTVHDGTEIHSVHAALQNHIGYIAKDRDGEALMLSGSILENICLPSLKKIEKCGFIMHKNQMSFIDPYANKLHIKMTSPDEYCMYLSGGNKQKVSIAKWLANEADILIMDCPTRGIDVGVKSDIYKLMVELKEQGKTIIMISEELPELIGMSDRIIIMKDGKISTQIKRSSTLSESVLIQYMI